MTNPARSPAHGASKSATRDIVVEDVLPHAIERVWTGADDGRADRPMADAQ